MCNSHLGGGLEILTANRKITVSFNPSEGIHVDCRPAFVLPLSISDKALGKKSKIKPFKKGGVTTGNGQTTGTIFSITGLKHYSNIIFTNRGDLKTLILGPWTTLQTRFTHCLMNRSMDYPYGPPPWTNPKQHRNNYK